MSIAWVRILAHSSLVFHLLTPSHILSQFRVSYLNLHQRSGTTQNTKLSTQLIGTTQNAKLSTQLTGTTQNAKLSTQLTRTTQTTQYCQHKTVYHPRHLPVLKSITKPTSCIGHASVNLYTGVNKKQCLRLCHQVQYFGFQNRYLPLTYESNNIQHRSQAIQRLSYEIIQTNNLLNV